MSIVGYLFVMRHGQTTCNADQVIQGPRIDAELSDLGIQQAAKLGEAFKHTQLDAIFTSPMRRARTTAAALAAGQGGDVATQVSSEAYELDFGDLCGRRMPDVVHVFDQVIADWDGGFVDRPFPGGESPVIAQHRIRPVAQLLAQQAAASNIALVAHGRINRVVLATILGLPLQEMRRFPQDNAAITAIEWTEAGPQIRRINDTSHLT